MRFYDGPYRERFAAPGFFIITCLLACTLNVVECLLYLLRLC